MLNSPVWRRTARFIIGRKLWAMTGAVLAVVVIALVASPALAQLTTQGLIGSAVTQVGPRFSDVDEAIKRFQNNDPASAREYLVMAKEKNPELPPTDVTLARMYYATNNGAAGRQTLEKVVREHPEDPEPFLIFAEQALAGGRLTDATSLYQEAQRLNKAYEANPKRKRNMEIRCHRGPVQIAVRRQDWPAAKQLLEAWRAIEPDSVSVRQNLGRAQFELDDARGAYQTLEDAAKLDKDADSADLLMAQFYNQKRNQERAKVFYENAIRTAGDNAKAQLAYARWLIETGEFTKAKSHVDRALMSEPDSAAALLLAGVIARMENKPDDAERYLSSAHLRSPLTSEPINQLALLLVEQNGDEPKTRAQQFALLGSRIAPDDVNAGITAAWVLDRNDRKGESRRLLQQVLQKNRRGASRDSNYFTAQMLYDSGNSQVAGRVVKAALEGRGAFLNQKNAQALADKIAAEGS